jgi:hypothetical protein
MWKICGYGIADLTVLECFCVAEEIGDLQHLKDRICSDIETVTPRMLSLVSEVAECGLDSRMATNGAHN